MMNKISKVGPYTKLCSRQRGRNLRRLPWKARFLRENRKRLEKILIPSRISARLGWSMMRFKTALAISELYNTNQKESHNLAIIGPTTMRRDFSCLVQHWPKENSGVAIGERERLVVNIPVILVLREHVAQRSVLEHTYRPPPDGCSCSLQNWPITCGRVLCKFREIIIVTIKFSWSDRQSTIELGIIAPIIIHSYVQTAISRP